MLKLSMRHLSGHFLIWNLMSFTHTALVPVAVHVLEHMRMEKRAAGILSLARHISFIQLNDVDKGEGEEDKSAG